MKQLFLALALVIITSAHSQQILKRITDTTDNVTVELYVLANGTDPNTVTGDNYFASGSGGVFFSYYVTVNETLTQLQHIGNTSEFVNNISTPIGAYNFAISNPRHTISNAEGYNTYIGEVVTGTQTVLNIHTEGYHGTGRYVAHNRNDVSYTKIIYNKKLINGSPVPSGTCARTVSGQGNYLDSNGQTQQLEAIFCMNFDGITWKPMETDCLGNTLRHINNVNDQLSSTTQLQLNNTLSAWPNPANNSLHISAITNRNDIFTYTIFDSIGRKLNTGNALFEDAISTSGLTTGNYFITISTNDTNKQTLQFIIK
nr:T9SS type A sorting domain-containing protein [uncultured Flavobacterium sp.]